jgi:hypothetical protein
MAAAKAAALKSRPVDLERKPTRTEAVEVDFRANLSKKSGMDLTSLERQHKPTETTEINFRANLHKTTAVESRPPTKKEEENPDMIAWKQNLAKKSEALANFDAKLANKPRAAETNQEPAWKALQRSKSEKFR